MSGHNYLCRFVPLLPLLVSGCSAPLTGTPLDLTPFGAILSAIGVLYWLLAAGALWLAIAYSPTRWLKVAAGVVVVAVFGYGPITHYWQQSHAIEAARARLAKADAMFQERCKKAGVNIYRTAEDVEGVFLMKLRPKGVGYDEPFKMDDPYGRDSEGDYYIMGFLLGRKADGVLTETEASIRGYRYVEAIDPKDGKRYRYTGSIKVVGQKDKNSPNNKIDIERNPNFDLNIYAFTLDKVPAPGPSPRYGVTYDDRSTREEREYWIAGSSLKVIDLKTNEVMAERIGYMVDRGQGATGTGGARAPWRDAADNACPAFADRHGSAMQVHQTRNFVEKVLHIKQEK